MNDTEHLASKIVQLSNQVEELDRTLDRVADALEALESTLSSGVEAWKRGTECFYGKLCDWMDRSAK